MRITMPIPNTRWILFRRNSRIGEESTQIPDKYSEFSPPYLPKCDRATGTGVIRKSFIRGLIGEIPLYTYLSKCLTTLK
jgi:hypothetical protein